uniref:Uncharacterized protein n=1 Tax=Siphoviridae sp. ctTnV63 TaxID=2825523 RepID=A0A8S5NVU7_9CAUD|nr:MAG TPA: hypothetical protein [Siphoviridae sp. ctTnV63]
MGAALEKIKILLLSEGHAPSRITLPVYLRCRTPRVKECPYFLNCWKPKFLINKVISSEAV